MILIIVLSPRLDLRRRVLQRREPVHVQTLVAEATIEALDGRVVGRFAATAEV